MGFTWVLVGGSPCTCFGTGGLGVCVGSLTFRRELQRVAHGLVSTHFHDLSFAVGICVRGPPSLSETSVTVGVSGRVSSTSCRPYLFICSRLGGVGGFVPVLGKTTTPLLPSRPSLWTGPGSIITVSTLSLGPGRRHYKYERVLCLCRVGPEPGTFGSHRVNRGSRVRDGFGVALRVCRRPAPPQGLGRTGPTLDSTIGPRSLGVCSGVGRE